jgi:hypothetical protein
METTAQSHVCTLCRVSFDSRNKLFKHVKVCTTKSEVAKHHIAHNSQGAGAVEFKYLYVVGGRLRGRTLRSVERFSFDSQLWEECPHMIENRGSHGAASVDGVLFSIGGGGFRSNLSSCEAFDGENWTCVAPLAVSRHALAVVDGTYNSQKVVYSVGGWIDGKECSKVVERYNPKGNTWETVAPLNEARKLHGVASFECGDSSSKLYTFGGNCDSPAWHTNTAEVYDPVANSWSYIAPMPATGGSAAASIQPYVFVFLFGKYVLRYDPVSNSYVKLSNLPLLEWHCFDVTVIQGTTHIYVLGGVSNGRWCKVLYRYDAADDSWTQLPSMGHARRRCACAIVTHSGPTGGWDMSKFASNVANDGGDASDGEEDAASDDENGDVVKKPRVHVYQV